MSATRTLRLSGDLVAAKLIAAKDAPAIDTVLARYSLAISPHVAALIDRAAPHDPIARQFVPDARELEAHPAEIADPIGDDAHSPTPGLVHRYEDRVLLKIVAACPVYCRFCFRRESVGEGKGGLLPQRDLDAALAYVAAHPEIAEVILTGGDPLVVSPRRLGTILRRAGAIPHVRTLRIHTRVPVVEPARIDAALVEALQSPGRPVRMVIHANHPRELSPAARAACAKLVGSGIALLSQSVLLAGVNDDAETLAALMRAFVETDIRPYYLHHPDLAPGTTHFRLPVARGRALVAAMEGMLPPAARPRYVLDLPGGFGKVPLQDAVPDGFGAWLLRDRHGELHRYRDALAGATEVPKSPD